MTFSFAPYQGNAADYTASLIPGEVFNNDREKIVVTALQKNVEEIVSAVDGYVDVSVGGNLAPVPESGDRVRVEITVLNRPAGVAAAVTADPPPTPPTAPAEVTPPDPVAPVAHPDPVAQPVESTESASFAPSEPEAPQVTDHPNPEVETPEPQISEAPVAAEVSPTDADDSHISIAGSSVAGG